LPLRLRLQGLRSHSKDDAVSLNWRACRLAVAACVTLGFLARLTLLARPVEVLVHRYLADDLFYYLNVAFYAARGQGSTFDGGITQTNGYNPLLMLLLTAAFRAGADKIVAIRIALLIEALGLAAAAWLSAETCIRRRAPLAAILTAGTVSVCPFFLWPTLTGFETGLAAATTLFALHLWDREARPVWVGAACGVAFLARVDALALAAVFLLLQARRRDWRAAGHTLLGLSVVTLPFVLWSIHRFGLLLPGSAVQKIHVRSFASVARSAHVFFTTLPEILVPHWVMERLPNWSAWGVSGFVFVAALLGARRLGAARTLLTTATVIAYATLADGFVDGALRRYLFTVWILALTSVSLAVDQDDWQNKLWPSPHLEAGSGLLAGLFVALILAAHLGYGLELLRWDRTTEPRPSYVGECRDLAPVIDRLLAPEVRIASFDSGSLGYFSPRPVINLDGLVNDDIRGLERTCREESYASCLVRYLHEKHVTVLVGGTAFGWTNVFKDWASWPVLYQSPPFEDGSRLVMLEVPD
jgi:hypothetical protein